MKICSGCDKEKNHSAFHKDSSKKDGLHSHCKKCRKRTQKEYYKKNKEEIKNNAREYAINNPNKVRKLKRNWVERNREYLNEWRRNYIRERESKDIDFKLRRLLKTRLNHALNGNIKTKNVIKLLGCTTKKLKKHLESQFEDGMSWENHGLNGWHIDHKIPCASFDLGDPNQQKECFHYTNLQPLWAEENLKKSNKI